MSSPYIRILRLPDQFTQLSAAVIAALSASVYHVQVLVWFFSITCLSIAAFIVNELVDRNDVDTYSWNSAHIRQTDKPNVRITVLMVALFTIAGLSAAYTIGLLRIAIALWLFGIAYSLPPVRLKTTFVLDVVTLLGAWWVFPILGVFTLAGSGKVYGLYVLATSCMAWSIFFPYQLADFSADRRGGLRGTHSILGMRRSLWFGFITGIFGLWGGIMLLVFGRSYWILLLLGLQFLVLFYYIHWLKMDDNEGIERSMQQLVMWYKPFAVLVTILLCVIVIVRTVGVFR